MSRTPSYRLHKASGQALVEIKGRRFYLGKHGTTESREKYHRILAEWHSSGVPPEKNSPHSLPLSVLLLRFLNWAKVRYVKHGKRTSEVRSYKVAMRPALKLYGSLDVNDFTPKAMEACQIWWIENGVGRKRANQHLYRLRRIFRWGVKEQLVRPATWQALLAVEGLLPGTGRESIPVRPVDWHSVAAIEGYVCRQVWAMVQLQWWTGCRPGEVCLMRRRDITTSGDVWEYRPESHKTEHHGIERIIYLGPQAQAVLTPWLTMSLDAYLFSPRDAHVEWATANKRRARRDSRRAPGEKYSTLTYGRAILRGCKKAGCDPWTANQLRHTAATRIRREFGIEAARVILGHQSSKTTEIYAETDKKHAISVIRQLG